jgi:hypothetical protein
VTDAQQIKAGLVYDAIAALMPEEGRDFRLEVKFIGNRVNVVMHGITPIGIEFAKHCMSNLEGTILKIKESRYGR